MKIIALDFDGTIIESNHIKDQAFETIFSDWPAHKEAMMQWHIPRDTVDRQEKFRYFVEEILGMHGNNKLINKLILRFSELTRKEIVECPMVAGSQAFLDYWVDNVSLFLVSATPQNELNIILEERHLDGYFCEAYGAPIDKVEVLKQIMGDEKVSADEMLYIGDSTEDQQAAGSLGIHFIGRQSDRPMNTVENYIFSDFTKIKEYLIEHYEF